MPQWTAQEISFLQKFYPTKGKRFCMEALARPEGSIRSRTALLGLSQDRSSEFFLDWQQRAAQSKIGKKRPAQALVINNLKATGRLVLTEAGKKAIGEKVRQRISIQGHPRGMLGKKHTAETRQNISKSSRKYWGEPGMPGYELMSTDEYRQMLSDRMHNRIVNGELRQGYSRGKQGKRVDLNNQYFRSAWEANYARYLRWLQGLGEIADWAYEPDTFIFETIKRGIRSYIPDFKIWETQESTPYYVEIKGWMDKKSQTKLKRMQKFYPEIAVVLVDKHDYSKLAKQLSRMIVGWE